MIPDPEKAIIAALVHYMPDLMEPNGRPRIYDLAPKDWHKKDFLVVRAMPGGSSSRPNLFYSCFFEIEAFALSRGLSSRLARRAQAAMAQASRESFRYEDPEEGGGYLFGFREVNSPSLQFDGLSSKHGDIYMFQGNYQISIRALR